MKNNATAHVSLKIPVRTGKYDFYLAMLFLYQTFGDICFINFTYLHNIWGGTMDINIFTESGFWNFTLTEYWSLLFQPNKLFE